MKKKVASKVLAGVLASTMVFGLAACGDDSGNVSGQSNGSSAAPQSSAVQATPEPTQAPPLEISVALPSDEEHLEANEWYDKLVAEINEKTNMKVNWEWTASATYYEQLPNKIQANNTADVIVGPNDVLDATALGAAQEGAFWDLEPYLDDYDNLATIPASVRKAVSVNGKTYYIPRSRNVAREGIGYRQDWAENLNLKFKNPDLLTWDEFADMLHKFTYNDPDGNGQNDTVGLGLDQWDGIYNIIFGWFNVPTNWGLDKDGNLVHYTQTEEYKTALKAIRELIDDGVTNMTATNGVDDYNNFGPGKVRTQLMATGKCGVMIQCLDDIRKAELAGGGLVEQGISDNDHPAIKLMNCVDCGYGISVKPNGGGYNGTLMISTKNIKTEAELRRVLDFLNTLCDGDMMNLIEYGWEGLTYMLDKNGNVLDYPATAEAKEKGIESTYKDYPDIPTLTDTLGTGSKKYSNGFNQVIAYYTAESNARPVVRGGQDAVIYLEEQRLYVQGASYLVMDKGAGLVSETYTDKSADLGTIISDAQTAYLKNNADWSVMEDAIARWMDAGGRKATEEMNALYKAQQH